MSEFRPFAYERFRRRTQLLIFQRKHESSHLMQMYLEKREQMLNQLRVLD